MGGRAAWVGAGLIFLAGVGIGSATDPAPEVKVVRVPEVKTRIEYRDPPDTVVWPESCTRAAALLDESFDSDSLITGSAGAILLSLQDLARESVINPVKVNPVIEEVRAEKSTLDEAVIDREEIISTAEFEVQNCLDDLNQ